MKKKVAVILSGCGRFDGSEIQETTLTLLALSKQGAEVEAFALNESQREVINHNTTEPMDEVRNIMVESNRIIRSKVRDIAEYNADEYDALILPGGLGAAKNLCSYAFDGENMVVNKSVERVIRETHHKGNPIGALCIAPIIIAKVLSGVTLTFGQDDTVSRIAENWGNTTEKKMTKEFSIDSKNKVVTTPCYMISNSTMADLYEGISGLVREVLAMC